MIVAIFGYKGSGKSALAKRFELHNFIRRPIAAPLKEMLKVGLGLTQEQLWGSEKEKPLVALDGKTARDAMTTLGKEWGRDLMCKDLWIRAWANTTPIDKNVVVDDLRFPNEADHLLSLGAYFVKIVRPNTEPEGEVHESEAYVDKLPWDLCIANDGPVDNLSHHVKNFVTDRPNVPSEGPARVDRFRAVLDGIR